MAALSARFSLSEAVQSLLGRSLTRRQVESLRWYAGELVAWNQRFNLTAITDPSEIESKHFLDLLSCLLAMKIGPPDGRSTSAPVPASPGFP